MFAAVRARRSPMFSTQFFAVMLESYLGVIFGLVSFVWFRQMPESNSVWIALHIEQEFKYIAKQIPMHIQKRMGI